MKYNEIEMVLTDFDGTLLRSDRVVSKKDYNTLLRLGNSGITRVVA
ncbi:Cof-type HAD-IIB family hydrolase, partial [candidate division KSB1 bacterium]